MAVAGMVLGWIGIATFVLLFTIGFVGAWQNHHYQQGVNGNGQPGNNDPSSTLSAC